MFFVWTQNQKSIFIFSTQSLHSDEPVFLTFKSSSLTVGYCPKIAHQSKPKRRSKVKSSNSKTQKSNLIILIYDYPGPSDYK